VDAKARRYIHESVAGRLVIGRGERGWWIQLNQEPLGSGFATPQHALDDLLSGNTHWPRLDVDPATIGLPSEIRDWALLA
jgi:hypothetical protein